jgi:peroxiredoxin
VSRIRWSSLENPRNSAELKTYRSRDCDMEMPMQTYETLPEGLPVPEDDGAARHLPGQLLPAIALRATHGGAVDASTIAGRAVIYIYPKTGVPGEPLPGDWDAIPGARGCTTEACAFRDHFAELGAAGASAVYGLSTQSPAYQKELHERLHLPFPLLSDEGLRFATALRLPLFEAWGETLLKRLTLVADDGKIVHVFYPIFPPDGHAEEVLAWLRAHPRGG